MGPDASCPLADSPTEGGENAAILLETAPGLPDVAKFFRTLIMSPRAATAIHPNDERRVRRRTGGECSGEEQCPNP